ncbi:MAG: ClpX C4-type zinc finger protein [Pseudomonadota bacterium]
MGWFDGKPAAPKAAPELHCSFCGASQRQVAKLIAGPEVWICDRCIRLCVDILEEHTEKPVPKYALPSPPPSLAELRAVLGRRCVGQERAKRLLVAALAQHLARLQPEAVPLRPPVVLLVGPHGCGKTTLAQALLEATTLPGYLADVNRLSATGYVGLDVENVLYELVRRAENDRPLAEAGVLVLDGLHRIRVQAPPIGSPRDITGESVQRDLLRVLDGLSTEVAGAGQRHPQMSSEPFSCARVLPVLTATFEDLPADEPAVREELAARGMLRELLARIDVVLPLTALARDESRAVLTRPEGGLLPERLAALAAIGCAVEVGDGAVEAMLEMAEREPADGAWSLRRPLARLAEEAVARGGAWTVREEDVRGW